MTKKQRIFSAIQPSGELHIGNYLGALKNFVKLQDNDDYECLFFIADYHSISGEYNPKEKSKQIFDLAKDMIAIFEVFSPKLINKKFDSTKVTIAIQSQVPEHTELAWIFNTVTPLSELQRMTQFKGKSQQQDKNINMGLLCYPVLMAADILIYKTGIVPVGQDQLQHLELTRKIARFFNNKFGETFPEPKDLITETPKIMSLLDPTKKMSKSSGPKSYIAINDSANIIMEKMKKAVSLSDTGLNKDDIAELFDVIEKPLKTVKDIMDKHGMTNVSLTDRGNLMNKYIDEKFVTKESQKAAHIIAHYSTLLDIFVKDEDKKKYFRDNFLAQDVRFSDLKIELAKAIANYFAPFREKRKELEKNPEEVKKILADGAEKARKITQKTMQEVREKIGVTL